MKRRLRKKKHVGEFREYGFEIRFIFSEQLSTVDRNSLLDDWICLAIENNGLQFGGGGRGNIWKGVVTSEGKGSTTEEQRIIIEEWLSAEPRVLDYEVGSLIDVWLDDKNRIDHEASCR